MKCPQCNADLEVTVTVDPVVTITVAPPTLHFYFKAALKPELRDQSWRLLNFWLSENGFIMQNGVVSSHDIEYADVRAKAIAWAKKLRTPNDWSTVPAKEQP